MYGSITPINNWNQYFHFLFEHSFYKTIRRCSTFYNRFYFRNDGYGWLFVFYYRMHSSWLLWTQIYHDLGKCYNDCSSSLSWCFYFNGRKLYNYSVYSNYVVSYVLLMLKWEHCIPIYGWNNDRCGCFNRKLYYVDSNINHSYCFPIHIRLIRWWTIRIYLA